jgi:ubiquinone/menaquinone biosynthesis C-methylase UbiE
VLRAKEKSERRSWDQIREHYELEKQLASRLRNAPAEDRTHLYSSLYDELYRSLPHHPRRTRRLSREDTVRAVAHEMRFLRPFFRSDSVYLEVGPGDCALALEVSRMVTTVYAVDVSKEATSNLAMPENFRLIISNGVDIPVPANSVDIAYSNQLMEHLHPDDAFAQLRYLFRALKEGGAYICLTPNRISGPHDISRYFDTSPTGFHLKEYSVGELDHLFRSVGFSKTRSYVGLKVTYLGLPPAPIAVCEMLLSTVPFFLRTMLARNLPLSLLLGIRLVGTK